jgi:hypothetical protein
MATRTDIKISIIIKGDRIFLGAVADGCDPKMATLQGDINAAAAQLPTFVAEANAAWDIAPHNPKTVIVTPPPAPTAPRVATTTATAARPVTVVKSQPKFF